LARIEHASAVPTMPPPTMHTSTGSAASADGEETDDEVAENARAMGRRVPARIRRASHVIAAGALQVVTTGVRRSL
jgi:hypothetical protein